MAVISDQEFKQLAEYIQKHYGIYLKNEKKTLVAGRLQHVLADQNFKSFTEYFEYLVNDKTKKASTILMNKITTNHTFFMREVDHFHFFRDQVLPYLKATITDKDLRVWSAGCSTGEEPYTLSMIINDFFGEEKVWWDTKILATDISERVLQIAKTGTYSNEQIAAIPTMWKLNYFKKLNGETQQLIHKIQNEIIFRKFNLVDSTFPFKKKFHVIFCRNVMIYFDTHAKNDLVNRFYEYLEPGGYLFIGHSESLNRDSTKFKYVMPAVYRRES
ncbi:protein-glutamate O-methyltransferase CheR [Bacillus sp. T3]|uniref:CheR family methyltransferase n=1 Tax=Bacillus sp. T3 TaxID=467262 RepID=UPI002982AC16|nr:protein-glutamate O-methyltransferase CheR [Bacillus sp. T3]